MGSRAWPNEHGWSFIRRDLCSKRGDRLGRTFPVSLTSLGSYGGSLGAKANAMGLDVRNLTRSPKHGEGSVIRFSMNLGHSEFWSQGLIHRTGTRMALGAKSCPILANRGVV